MSARRHTARAPYLVAARPDRPATAGRGATVRLAPMWAGSSHGFPFGGGCHRPASRWTVTRWPLDFSGLSRFEPPSSSGPHAFDMTLSSILLARRRIDRRPESRPGTDPRHQWRP